MSRRSFVWYNARRTTIKTHTEIIAYLVPNVERTPSVEYPSWFYLLSTTGRECKRRRMCLSNDLHEIFRSRFRCVIRLSLSRRLVNLLPVAQRTNAFTNGVVDRTWVVGRQFDLTSTMKTIFKEKWIFSCQESDNHFPWVPRDCCIELRSRHVRPHTKTKNPAVQKGERVL